MCRLGESHVRESVAWALVVLFITAAVAPLLFGTASTAQFPWRRETIGQGAGVRSVAVDYTGRVHTVYGRGIPVTELVYAVKAGGSWNITEVDAGAYFDSSLDLDASGSPHVAYYRNDRAVDVEVRYAHLQGLNFVNETIEVLDGLSPGPSIAVDGAGRPHVVFWNNGGTNNWRLRYAVQNGAGWTRETIGTFNFVNTYEPPSMALDSQGNPRVAVHPVGSSPLYVYRRDNGSWTRDVADWWPFRTCCEVPSLALDSRDLPHIASYNLTGYALRYAHYEPVLGQWLTENVYEQGGDVTSPGRPSLTLDWQGHPRISYFDTLALQLRYFYFDGIQWTMETPDPATQTGNFNGLALDPVGAPHIVYTHWTGTTYVMEHAWQEWPDGVPPSSSVQPIQPYWGTSSPLGVNATATDPGVGVANVTLWHRFSTDNATWGPWIPSGTLESPPWTWRFPFPDGEGYYEFCTTAIDLLGNEEPPPPRADATAGYDATPPVSSALPIFGYWRTTPSVVVDGVASDMLSGVSDATLWFAYAPDNVSWGPWTPFGTDLSSPWSWSFPFPDGEGNYRFHTIARDLAGNVEGAKTIAEAIAGYRVPPDYAAVSPSPTPPVTVGLSLAVTLSIDVANLGGRANTTATLAFFNASAPGSPFASYPVPPVSAGGSAGPFTAIWISPGVPGAQAVTASVDYGNNLEESDESNNVYMWMIDVVAGPVTSLVVGQPNVTAAATYITSSTPLALTVLDQGGTGVRTTRYRIDGGPWLDYAGPFTVSTQGERFLEWYSEDNAGNVEALRAAVLRVDDTAPTTAIAVGPPKHQGAGLFVTSASPITLSAVDGGVTPVGPDQTLYRVDGSSWSPYATVFTLAGSDGARTIEYRSKDLLGNVEAVRTLVLLVDNTPPVTSGAVGSPRYQGAELYIASASPISLNAVDGGTSATGLAATEYRLQGATWSLYTAPFTITGVDEAKTIEYRSADLLGNTEPARALRVVLDNTPPRTSISPAYPPFPADTRFTLTGTDDGSGVNRLEYRVDGGAWTPYAGPFGPVESGHVLGYRSVDKLGNAESERTLTVPTETTPLGFNWKPVVAAAFAFALLVVGVWSSREAPWKGAKGRRAAFKALAVFALPFVLSEAATGVVSSLTGLLSIPPLLGLGTAVDSAILLTGLAVGVHRGLRARSSVSRNARR